MTSRPMILSEKFNGIMCFNGEQSTSYTGDSPQILGSLSSPCP